MKEIELDQKNCGCNGHRCLPGRITSGQPKRIVLDDDYPHGRIRGSKKCDSDVEAVRIGVLSKG